MIDYFDKEVRKEKLNELANELQIYVFPTTKDIEACREYRKVIELIKEESKVTVEEKIIEVKFNDED